MDEIVTIVGFLFFLFIYLLPSIIAISKKNIEKNVIIVINILLGLTLIGWVVTLIWALSDSKEHYLKKLEQRYAQGLISEQEYQKKKESILSKVTKTTQ